MDASDHRVVLLGCFLPKIVSQEGHTLVTGPIAFVISWRPPRYSYWLNVDSGLETDHSRLPPKFSDSIPAGSHTARPRCARLQQERSAR